MRQLPLVLGALLIPASLAGCGGGGSGGGQDGCGPIDPEGQRPNSLAAVINEPATLKKSCSPYALEHPVTVTAALTIEPGVVIEACMGGCKSRITVARTGSLEAVGTPEEPILFTSRWRESMMGPPRGQWTGLLFLETTGSRLEHVTFQYGGGTYGADPGGDEFTRYEFPEDATLMSDSSSDLVVEDVIIEHSRGYSVAATTADEYDADPATTLFASFDRVTATDGQKGFWLPVNQGGALGADVCFQARGADGLCPATPAGAGVRIEAHLDDAFGRTPEDVGRDATWKRYGAPWQAENVNVVGGAALTIDDGVTLHMTDLGGIYVGLGGPGTLRMVAANPGGIVVTSATDAPPADDHWKGLYVWDMADATTEIRNVELSYGGRQSPREDLSPPAILGVFNTGDAGAQPTIVGNVVHHSAGAGISWNCLAAPVGLEPTNEGNQSGDSIACEAAIGSGVAENLGCTCPGSCAEPRCPNP